VSPLQEFRREKDAFFARHPQSPLLDAQRRTFKGLAYFEENPELRVDGPLENAADPGEVGLETTGGGPQVYRRRGVVRFEVAGQPVQVTLFAAQEQHELFLPFRDATSGQETYAAGRYLDVAPPVGGRVVIDFNYAYNPYCAYNERWSCPLPPVENWLKAPIRAGEKAFAGGH